MAGWSRPDRADPSKMHFATHGTGGDDHCDITDMTNLTSVTVGIGGLAADEIHLQTLCPVT